jgi:type I restriction enzyme S subunit
MGDLFAIDKIDSSVAPTLMTELSDAELDKHRVQGGDLLFCRTSVAAEGVGKCSIVRDASSPLVPASNLIRVRVDPDKVDPCFAYYYFRSAAGSKQLRNMVRGAAVFTITGGDIGLVEFPRFALADQSQIASMLDAFDGLIENNRRRIELLEETARLLYREWFVNFRYPGHEGMPLVDSEIGPIPEHWRVETLGDLAEVVKDTVGPASIPSGSPLVGLEHLPRRSTTLADWDLATEVGSRRAIFRDGDVLFGKIRPYFHKVVETPFSGYCSTDAVVLRPVRDSDSAQLLSVVSSDDFIAHASASANGTKMPRANMDVLMRFPVPRPTESVSQAFEETAKPLTELAKQLIRTNSRLTEARDLLLPRLVSGDLDISDLELNLEAVG